MPKHSEQLLGTYGNLLNTKKHEIFDFKKKRLTEEERKKEERRTKQSLDSPQTIEANNNIICIFLRFPHFYHAKEKIYRIQQISSEHF